MPLYSELTFAQAERPFYTAGEVLIASTSALANKSM